MRFGKIGARLEQTLGRISVLWQYQAHRDSGLSLAVVAPGTARFPIDGFRVTTTNTGYLFGTLLFGGTAPFEQITTTSSTATPVYLVNRYYDPTTGGFTGVDPDVAETGQAYAYVGDDPVDGSDPLGLCNSGVANGYYPGACATTGAEAMQAEAYIESHVQSGGFSISNGLKAVTDYGAGIADFVTSTATLGHVHVSAPYCGYGWAYDVGYGYGAAASLALGGAGAGATEAEVDSESALTQTLYRFDSRGPDEIFQDGFEAKGGNLNLLEHVTSNPLDSGYVSTSDNLNSAQDFASESGSGYIYKLNGSGINVNDALGDSSPYPWENEVAIPGSVPGSAIEGAWDESGSWTPNSAYQG